MEPSNQRYLFTKSLIINEWIIQMETNRDSAENLGIGNSLRGDQHRGGIFIRA